MSELVYNLYKAGKLPFTHAGPQIKMNGQRILEALIIALFTGAITAASIVAVMGNDIGHLKEDIKEIQRTINSIHPPTK